MSFEVNVDTIGIGDHIHLADITIHVAGYEDSHDSAGRPERRFTGTITKGHGRGSRMRTWTFYREQTLTIERGEG